DDPDSAQMLLDAGGSKAEHYDLKAISAEIATGRLRTAGYDAMSAGIVARYLIDDGPNFWGRQFEALDKAKAFRELGLIGDAYLAQARQIKPELDALISVELFAAASDCYLRAGNRDAAIAVAREGMRLIPMALANRPDIPDMAE